MVGLKTAIGAEIFTYTGLSAEVAGSAVELRDEESPGSGN
jgi:hypothetical protein